jgi:hypothetical protein
MQTALSPTNTRSVALSNHLAMIHRPLVDRNP